MKWFNLLQANVRKEYIELKRYLPNTLAYIITFYVIFLGMFAGIQVIGDPSTQDVNTQYMIVNYIFWFLGMLVVQNIGWEITNEAMRGTLEQLYMSPLGVWRIMASRLIATTVINFFIMVALLYLSMLTTNQWLNVDVISVLPIFILTLFSMFGVGLMVAGISIIWKQVNAFLQILQFIIAGLTFVPLSVAPYLAYFPFVKGVDLVRGIMINGTHISEIGAGEFALLIGNGIVYFALGLLIFISCERFAMKKGLLAHY
ncbi:ABC transporter permease [Virgibacillus soli]|uniref:ABC transporter permease n=1 Tax=Paracerasibacillus soli TaxID=480284 RepID=A0ABU5CP25_9BACI|nr:ABC transporter permease [Virgibacillus soli]MDY0407592.1 ABC transporter permease [Virgibacillus soli]